MQLGDDNRAIEDFDFVIKLEPKNVMASLQQGVNCWIGQEIFEPPYETILR